MNKQFFIFDESIEFLNKVKKNINSIPTMTYYFVRKTKTAILPIEITIVKLKDRLMGISPQLNDFSLRIFDGKMFYKNDIEFYIDEIDTELSNLTATIVDNNIVDVYKDVLGINLENIENINGLTFEKILYVEDVPVENMSATSDGYVFVFTDMSSNKVKLGMYVGNVRPLKYAEYIQRMSEIGASNILNNVIVKVDKNVTTITNNNELLVEIGAKTTTYNVESKKLGEKIYTREATELDPIILRPGQSIEIPNDITQEPTTYTLYSNPVKYIDTPISNYSPEYVEQEDYIRFRPIEFSLKRSGLEIPESTFDDFFIVSEFTDVTKLKEAKMYIFSRKNNKEIVIPGDFGEFSVNSISDLYKLTTGGFLKNFVKKDVITTMLKLNDNQYVFDYSFDGTEQRIVQIAKQTVYNDVISQHQEALFIEVGNYAAYEDFINHNRKIVVEPQVIKREEVKYGALPYLMDSYKFVQGVMLVSITDIADSPLRKTFSDYIFKSYDRELDNVIERYSKEQKRLVSNFKFLNFDIQVSTAELAQLSPDGDIWDVYNDSSNDFVYHVKKHLADLGYEIALDEALKKLKRLAYVYTPEKDLISTTKIGITLDNKWYFNGTDFYKAEDIENPKITTYQDDVLKEYALQTQGNDRFIYSKKIFFGYANDLGQEIEVAKQMLLALSTNKPIDPDILYQNPALYYMMSHTLDGSENIVPNYEDYTRYPAKFLFKPIVVDNKNKFLWPNVFNFAFSGSFTSGGIFSKAKQEEMKRTLLNTATDVLDSVQKIKIKSSTYCLIDYVNMKLFSSTYKASGYKILGIENFDYGPNDVIKFEYAFVEDKIIDGYNYTSGMEFYMNNKTVFGMYYNYLTHQFTMVLSEKTVITDYSFLISLFDALLHYNIDTIEGFEFNSLGEYCIKEELEDGTLKVFDEVEPKYLYTPQPNPLESDYELYGVCVNYLNKTWYLDRSMKQSIVEDVELGKIDGKPAKVNVMFTIDEDNKKLLLSKQDGVVDINLLTLQNLPTKMISYGSFVVKPIKGKKFMPLEYNKFYLDMVGVRFDIEDHIEIMVLEFGEFKSFKYNNITYNITLNGDGLQVWKVTGNHVTELETIFSIKDILVDNLEQRELKELKTTIVSVDGGKL